MQYKKVKNRKKDALAQLMQRYKHKARENGVSFDIDFEVFCNIVTSNCIFCGHKITKDENYHIVDRIIYSKDYTLPNSIPSCSICYRLRHSYPLQTLKKLHDIYKKLEKLQAF